MTDPVLPFVARRLARVATDALRVGSTYLLGEPVIGMDPNAPQHIGRLFMGDGSTPGGLPHAFLSELQAETARAQAAEAALAGGVAALTPPTGRLTLASGVGVTSSDITGATTVYYTGALTAPLYNGAAFTSKLIGELSLPLDANTADAGYHAAGSVFDIFLFNGSGNVIDIGSGPAWATTTSRGTGAGTTELQLVNGIWTNKNAITLRFGTASGNTVVIPANQATYVGSFSPTVNGQATDTFAKRLVFNAYNVARRPMRISETASSWTYSTSAWRVTNGNTANQVQMLLGLAGVGVNAKAISIVGTSAAGANPTLCGIGLSATVNAANVTACLYPANANPQTTFAEYDDFPGLGLASLYWLEYGMGTPTQTWYGSNGNLNKSGLTAAFLG